MRSFLNAFRFAARELRGARGFGVFVACLTLGVAAIAGVGSITSAFLYGLSAEGRVLLGGDVEVELSHRPATEEERAYFAEAGTVSEIAEMRGMARAPGTGERRLVELKAVDARYPLFGAVVLGETLRPGMGFQEALAKRGGRWGVVAEPSVLDRLGIRVGDIVRIGVTEFTVRATLREEPDRIAGTFRLGPRVFMPLAALSETGLVQPGSLIDYAYRIAMPEGTSEGDIKAWRQTARDGEFGSDWSIRDRRNGAPGTAAFIRQMSVFLTLVGLTALMVGGVGVGHAVSAYLDRKRATIATFKCLGASGGMVFGIYLLQILALAAIGIVLGLAIGASMPWGVHAFMGGDVPVPARLGIYPQALALAAAYGVLVAIAFAVWP
ncbi:MAG: ABC transporter permease, partial [Alphaproteobacteria bacterium]